MSNKLREVYQLALYYNVSEIDYLSYLITVIYQVPLASNTEPGSKQYIEPGHGGFHYQSEKIMPL